MRNYGKRLDGEKLSSMLSLLATVVTLLGLVVLTACSGSPNAPTLRSIQVSPPTASVTAGGTQQFTAMGTYSDNHTATLTNATWSSSATSIATIDASGLAT